jgi:hypothetical protein
MDSNRQGKGSGNFDKNSGGSMKQGDVGNNYGASTSGGGNFDGASAGSSHIDKSDTNIIDKDKSDLNASGTDPAAVGFDKNLQGS